ncbi:MULTISPECIES: hypothetical protein [Mycobacteriaceae]|uniref:hypothetical protein n=1 Tax=unclassified Mycobacterium TaxID=2642494 RepID=UPI0009E9D6EE|nr:MULTISPECIES: hypothetical protein [Mycobacteriaceae]CRL72733.1 hypothetical protein CPGR_02443 [Mycolicibacterium malmesburyense]
MGANEKLLARRRAWEAQRKKREERVRRDRANAAGAEEIRAILHRIGTVDTWERKRFDQAAENIRADAVKRRAAHFRELQAVVDQMRARGQTFAQIAELVRLDVREIQTVLRRARTGDQGGRGSTASAAASPRPVDALGPNTDSVSVDPLPEDVTRGSPGAGVGGGYDPTRCVRCDAVMLDEDAAPRRGRRRLYCSDTCRRDASSARTAAQRYGAPIRVVEVPKVTASQEQSEPTGRRNEPVVQVDAVGTALGDAGVLCELLTRVAEQARLKKLDRATLTAARDLSNAVHPHRSW